jgi:TonB family protein
MNHSSPSFHTIETPHTSWSRWVISLGINAAFVFIFIAIPVAASRSITAYSHYVAVRLEDPPVIPSPVIPPPVVKLRAPEPVAPIVARRPIPLPVRPVVKPVVKPVLIEPPPVETPEAVRTPEPKFELPTPPAPKPAVKTEVFTASVAAPVGPKPVAHEVNLGGFGDPQGAHPSAEAAKGLTVPKVGRFDLPSGRGEGGAGGHAKVVAMAGFGSTSGTGSDGSSSGHVNGAVKPSGFGFGDYTTAPVSSAAKTAATSSPAVAPVEITFKPKPAYTVEARQQKLEGEVQLDVVFSASGQVHVLRVVRGLGLGLDESARAAAAQIRFRPGTKDGSPVDMRGIVHIVFELS